MEITPKPDGYSNEGELLSSLEAGLKRRGLEPTDKEKLKKGEKMEEKKGDLKSSRDIVEARVSRIVAEDKNNIIAEDKKLSDKEVKAKDEAVLERSPDTISPTGAQGFWDRFLENLTFDDSGSEAFMRRLRRIPRL